MLYLYFNKKRIGSLRNRIILPGSLFILILVILYWEAIIEELGIAITFSTLSIVSLKSRIQREPFSPKFEANTTHLWSIRLADKKYFRLAHLLPCRTVIYTGGLEDDPIDSCNYSPTQEFSVRITLNAQKWLFNHQHPTDCSNKKFAIINNYAVSGLGSTLHQIVWAFAKALSEDRIAVYESPGNWLYGDCSWGNPDCFFLPISNCSIPSKIDGRTTITIDAKFGHWNKSMQPTVFRHFTFNWYRSQLLFYLTRYNVRTFTYVQNMIAQNFLTPFVNVHQPFIAVYVRRSDKVRQKEMSQSYTLQQYFDLFEANAKQVNITAIYLNSEDPRVFEEFSQLNERNGNRYQLLNIQTEQNVIFRKLISISWQKRGQIILQFLTDLFIEVNADLHVGTLTSNWCRLVDEIRLVMGKTIPFYTPEHAYFINA